MNNPLRAEVIAVLQNAGLIREERADGQFEVGTCDADCQVLSFKSVVARRTIQRLVRRHPDRLRLSDFDAPPVQTVN